MAVTVTCTGVLTDPNTGHLTVQWSNGTEDEYGSAGDLAEAAGGVGGVETAKRFLLARWLSLDPQAASPGLVVGKSLTLDVGGKTTLSISSTL